MCMCADSIWLYQHKTHLPQNTRRTCWTTRASTRSATSRTSGPPRSVVTDGHKHIRRVCSRSFLTTCTHVIVDTASLSIPFLHPHIPFIPLPLSHQVCRDALDLQPEDPTRGNELICMVMQVRACVR
jgi:hypothetical protein